MSIAVWDAAGRQIGAPDHMMFATSAAFSPDSRYLAYNKDQGLKVVDVTSGRTVKEVMPNPGITVSHLAYRGDGEQILGTGDNAINVFDSGSGSRAVAQMTDPRGIKAAIFSADGRYIISADGSNLRIWDAATRSVIGDLTGGPDDKYIDKLEITDDNRTIVAGSHLRNWQWPGPSAWPDLLCAKLTQNMSEQQWNEWVESSIPYTAGCPDLPKLPDQPPG